MADSPGTKYNPAFFYGQVGTGKTHLLNAIFNSVQKKGYLNASIYCAGELFSEIVKSVCNQKFNAFKEKLKKKSLLLIDDVQFFSEKRTTQEILNSILQDMSERKIQVVLSAKVFPKDLKGFDETFIGWMGSGIIVDIGQHDQELKQAFIKKTTDKNKVLIQENVVRWLAGLKISDLRTLHGAVMRLCALSDMNGMEITLEMSREALKDFIKDDNKMVVSLNDIQENAWRQVDR